MLCFKATAIKRHKTTATKCRPQGHATSSYSPSAWGDHSCKIAENTWCHDYKMVTEEENVEKLDILSHDNKVLTATFTVHL